MPFGFTRSSATRTSGRRSADSAPRSDGPQLVLLVGARDQITAGLKAHTVGAGAITLRLSSVERSIALRPRG